LVLVPINWGVEARKWQVLLQPLERIPFLKSFRAILAGLAFSMNTPNRIGEYGGRVLYVQEGHRWKAVSLTIIGSISQLIVTMVLGVGGLAFLLQNAMVSLAIAPYAIWIKVLFFGTISATVLMVLFYFRLGKILLWAEKIPGIQRYLRHISIIENLPVTILLRTLSLSVVRYSIFVIQYILLLHLFGVEVGIWTSIWLISVLYLVLAIIPTIALAELGIRGQASLLLFMLVSSNKLGIVGAATSIWLINLIVPALIGSLLILSIKIFSDK